MTNSVLELEEKFESLVGKKVHLFGRTFVLKMVEVSEAKDGKFSVEINGRYKIITDNVEQLVKKLSR